MAPHRRWPGFFRNLNWRTKSLLILVGSALLIIGVIAATEWWVVLPRVERDELASFQRQVNLIASRHAEHPEALGRELAGLSHDDLVQRIRDANRTVTGLRVRVYQADEPVPPLRGAKEIGPGRYVAAVSTDEMVGRLIFTDEKGRYSGALELRSPRPLRESQAYNAYLELLLTGGAVLFIAVGLWFVIKFAFVQRLETLNHLVSRLDSGAVRTLQSFPGDDEVGRLARTTGKMAGHLGETRDMAVSADRAKSAFLRLVTHELRTPMNGVMGFSSLLRDTPLAKEQQDYVRAIEDSSQLLMKLIDQLLDYTAMQAVGINLTPRSVHLREWLRSITRVFEPQAMDKKLDFLVEVNGDVPDQIWIDAERLQQVLAHLLGNALKFTSAGSVRLTVEMQPPCRADESLMRFRITDTGIGIAPEIRSQLFEPFSPGDSSQTRKFGGLGMGLVVCRRLANAMGGTISFESEPGLGSDFRLVIPVQTSAPQPSPATAGQSSFSEN